MRRSTATGLVLAGLAIGAWGCSSSPLERPAPMDGGGVGGSGAGGDGVGGSGVGGSGVGGSGFGGSGVGGGITGPLVGSGVALFDSDSEGFVFSTYDEPANLARPTNPSVPPPALSFDATQGSPSPGSLRVMAPYSGANQYVDIQKLVNVPAPLDWSGKILRVRFKVSQGTFTGIAEPYVSTTSTYTFGGTSFRVAPGTAWQEFALDLANAVTRNPGYNPAQVMVFGLHLNTGSAGANATPVVFNLDTFSITP